jgi:flagellar hook protein FlgE
VLVSRGSGERVAGLSADGSLVDISIANRRVSSPIATSRISFVGNLSLGGTEQVLPGVELFDSLGVRHTLDVRFINNDTVLAGSWLIDVRDPAGALVAAGGEVRFNADGSPAAGFNTYSFSYQPPGAPLQTLELYLGEPGRFDASTSFSAGVSSTLSVREQDGRARGALASVSFDANGAVRLAYTNGDASTGGQLALATFRDLQALVQAGAGRFLAPAGLRAELGRPGNGVFGDVVGGNIELSNVELTQEFTDLIIVQRGFQASSQVIGITNEMLQQLMDMGRSSG